MLITHFLAAYRRWRSYRLTMNELSQLSDRELSDLGISRYDIRATAWDAAARQ